MEMSIEQQRAVALASARLRLQEANSGRAASPAEPPTVAAAPPDDAERLAGNPLVRFALGAASPVLGGAQLASEALGFKGVTEHLKRLEGMKQRGNTEAADIERARGDLPQLKAARELMAKLPGYEATIAELDRKIKLIEEGGASNEPRTDVAGFAGTMLSPAVLGAMKLAPAATVGGRAAQGAGIGAAFGLTTPVVEGDNFASSKVGQTVGGAAIGGAIPPAFDLARKGAGLVRNVVDPFLPGGVERSVARVLREAAGSRQPQVEAALAADARLVPGSAPTAAEVAAPAGSAEFSALQTVAKNRLPSDYRAIAEGQEAARLAAVRDIGKTPADLKAAKGARAGEAAKNYGAVRDTLVMLDKEVGKLMGRPSMDKALARARELAEEEGRVFQIGTNAPEQVVASKVLGPSGQPAATQVIPEQVAKYPVQSLHYVKMALDDMIRTPEQFGIGASEVGAIRGTRAEFLKWLDQKAPMYEKARAVHAAMSKPMNEMKVGQELEAALTKQIGEGERPAVFGGAVRDAPRTIKRATGDARYEELSQVLRPEQVETVQGVVADLARKARQTQMAQEGGKRVSEILGPVNLPGGPLEREYTILRSVLSRISKGTTEKTVEMLAETMKVPASALRFLQSLPDSQKQAAADSLLRQRIIPALTAAGTAASSEAAQ